MRTTSTARPQIEYRFNSGTTQHVCPVCNHGFETRIGMWPMLVDGGAPVCGREDCPVGDEVDRPSPCDTLFQFANLSPATLKAIQDAAADVPSVAERLRVVSLNETLPAEDRQLLQLAAIDLQYCQADTTRIESLDNALVLRTCGEAAAEMLLSGCGDIL